MHKTKLLKKNVLTDRLLSGDMWRLMFYMSIPALLATSVGAVSTFVDAFYVGQFLGPDALGAVSLVLPLTMIIGGIASLIGVGCSSLLSRSIGSSDLKNQSLIFSNLIALSIISSILITFFGVIYASELLILMGGSGIIEELGVRYLKIILIGAVFSIFSNSANTLILAEGKVKVATAFVVLANLINMMVTPVLLIHFKMGVEGAAIGTLVATICFATMVFGYFIKGYTSYPINLKGGLMSKSVVLPVIKVGVSAMLLQVLIFIQQAVVFRSLAFYGGDWDITFMGACYRVMFILLIPGFAFAQGMQPIVGMNYGANNYERVKKSFRVFTISYTLFTVLVWMVVMVYPRHVLGLLIPNYIFSNADIFNFRIMLVSAPLYPYFLMSITLFQSIGNGLSAGITLICRELVLFLPLVYLLPMWYDIAGIYAALMPINVMMMAVIFIMIRRQFSSWRKMDEMNKLKLSRFQNIAVLDNREYSLFK